VFFRSSSITDAVEALRSMGHLGGVSYFTFKMLNLASVELMMVTISLVILFVVDFQLSFRPQRLEELGRMRWLSTGIGVALVYYIMLFGVFGHVEFIYFQF
jgi:hypothetical protein